MPVLSNEEPPISLNISFIGEKILETRTQKNRPKFLIKWRGRNDHENSWEHLSCLDYIHAILEGNDGLLDNSVSVRTDFCWTCKGTETTVDCPTCNRSFHSKCAKTDRLTPNELVNWRCDTCVEISVDEGVNRSKNLNLELLNRMLKMILHRILDDEEFQYFRFPVCKIRRQVAIFTIVNPVNISTMLAKIDKYKSSAEFFSDLQWIFHYCHTHYSDNEEVCKIARRLLSYARNELDSLEMCADCYIKANQNINQHFMEVCDQPHLLIWAKMKKFPFWPAKLMSINGNTAKVRFFQEKNNANVPVVDCFIYSREPPTANNQRESSAYLNAVQEAKVYIDNVQKKFGGFTYAKVRTPLHPEALSEHLIFQIPALKNTNQNQVKPKPLVGRRKSIFTIPLLRRKSIAEPPANTPMSRRKSIAEPPTSNNGPRKIDLRRQTTFVSRETKKEIKPNVSRSKTSNVELDRNPKLELKTPQSQTALKRKMPSLESEIPAKRTPNDARNVLMRAIELKTKNLQKNGVIVKRHQPVRQSNGGISVNKTPIMNGDRSASKIPTTPKSTPKTPILPNMPNVFEDDINGHVNNDNINVNRAPDPRLRSRNPSSVYQTRRELSFTGNSMPRINGLNGSKSPKSKVESMCQAFMLKMQTGVRELVSGLVQEQNQSGAIKPDAKMKMLLELENAKQLEMIEEKHSKKISDLEKSHRDSLSARNSAHKKQIEDLQKAQFDKVNELKDKYYAELKKKNTVIGKLQDELKALRTKVAPPKK